MMFSLNLRSLFAALVTFVALGGSAAADVFHFADIRLSQLTQNNSYQLFADLSTQSIEGVEIVWPEGCLQTGLDFQRSTPRSQLIYEIACDRPISDGDVIQTNWRIDGGRFVAAFPGAGLGGEAVRLPGGRQDLVIELAGGGFAPRGLIEVAAEFLWQGALHIWFGWDHLAFVFCLCLLAGGGRLLNLVTAFTLGHSISLGVSFFGLVSVPIAPVEAIIALSIAFMAREALMSPNPATLVTLVRPMIVVFMFGLLHGLGFASALEQLGVINREKWPALIFFNIGVEFGQIVFVVAAGLVMRLGSGREQFQTIRTIALYGVGVIGCFWMIERVIGFTLA